MLPRFLLKYKSFFALYDDVLIYELDVTFVGIKLQSTANVFVSVITDLGCNNDGAGLTLVVVLASNLGDVGLVHMSA